MTRAQVAGALVLVVCGVVWFLVLTLMEPTETPGGTSTPRPSCQPGPAVVVGR